MCDNAIGPMCCTSTSPEADHLPRIHHRPATLPPATPHCPSHHVVGQVVDCLLLLCVYNCVILSHQ